MLLRLLILLGLIALPSLSYAQDSEGLGGYVPPPLFGGPAPTPAPVTPQIPKPASAKTTPVAPKPTSVPVAPPVKIVQPPIPARKPEGVKMVRPGAEPIDFIRKQRQKEEEEKKKAELAKAEAAKKQAEKVAEKEQEQEKEPEKEALPVKNFEAPEPSQGVVKGPKTMPSVKKQSVDAEVTFEPLAPPVNMLERVQEESVKEEEAAEPVLIAKSNLPLPEFQKQPDGNRKLVLLYTQDQSALANEQLRVLQELIVPQLEENANSRLLIEAYASPRESESISADRRLALSRALAIREYAMGRQIASNRIDVRSLGSQSNVQPLDRVELYLSP